MVFRSWHIDYGQFIFANLSLLHLCLDLAVGVVDDGQEHVQQDEEYNEDVPEQEHVQQDEHNEYIPEQEHVQQDEHNGDVPEQEHVQQDEHNEDVSEQEHV